MRKLEDLKPVDTNLYLSRHNYYVLVDYMTKKIYKIQKEDYNKYRLFRGRYLIALLMGIILYGYNLGWKLAIASALAIAILLEGLYRKYYLETLDTIEGYELPEKISKLDILLTGTVQQVQKRVLGTLGLFILVAASAVYFLFYDNMHNYTNTEKYIFGALSVAMLIYIAYLGIVNFKALQIKKKEWEESHSKKEKK